MTLTPAATIPTTVPELVLDVADSQVRFPRRRRKADADLRRHGQRPPWRALTRPVTITVTGTNDTPTLAAEFAGELADCIPATTVSTISRARCAGTDVDHSETATLRYAALDRSPPP